MKIIIVDSIARVTGLKQGEKILFFAKIDDIIGYCVIFGPKNECTPGELNFCELFSAKVAFGKVNEKMDIVDVKHGHKYKEGGGMVETERGNVVFHLSVVEKPSIFQGEEVQQLLFTS